MRVIDSQVKILLKIMEYSRPLYMVAELVRRTGSSYFLQCIFSYELSRGEDYIAWLHYKQCFYMRPTFKYVFSRTKKVLIILHAR